MTLKSLKNLFWHLITLSVALILTPVLCVTILRPVKPGTHGKHRGFFGWFNRKFDQSTHHYTNSVARMLQRSGRYLVIYGVIVAGKAVLFMRLLTSLLLSEDQGVLATQAILPAGATQ